ncbi:DUF6473 family protein [Yoonia litorea]|uniref:DUF6473 domain-containing protein n=1 Tax=Yoonia litorea TaxID=1123755 RepID=A0A1I6MXQ1_9RHOB|nr:DUF6473 family protein [Yoonia litorea]SFS20485.1 hypothetical protein SAMN05444714_2650 [Yoonia litorea]
MKQEQIEDELISYSPCRYHGSRMLFRGPRKRLNQPYLAFVGGTATYGKFIEHPFPYLVEKAMRQPAVNLGCINGGIDAFLGDPAVTEICQNADLTVLQIMGANVISNRFYSVHPRRNDRFVGASSVMQAIYPDVDFTGFSFTRHMLGALQTRSTDRFETIVTELRTAWTARMRRFIEMLGRPPMLLWLSDTAPSDVHWSANPNQLQADPLFVTKTMVEDLRPLVRDIVYVTPSREALSQGVKGMVFPPSQRQAASEMLGVSCHREAAEQLVPAIREQLYAL